MVKFSLTLNIFELRPAVHPCHVSRILDAALSKPSYRDDTHADTYNQKLHRNTYESLLIKSVFVIITIARN